MGHHSDYDHERFTYKCPFCKTEWNGIGNCPKCTATHKEMFSGKRKTKKKNE